ncbi:hypothetical protein [Streptomyces sp. NPDC047070]|uniref:hypothetical protein n=1 Tax=Streptomyces sp. NPDC047070 TaxID=3154923 RepID=UPI003453CC79
MSGTGSIANPYIVNADDPPCSAIRPCISAGDGASYNPVTGVVTARLSTDPDNIVQFGGDGGLYAQAPAVDCAEARACLSGADGIDYDPLTGVIAVNLSGDPGNNASFGGDGGVYVPTGAATVTTGCGLDGDGSGGDPVRVAVGTWPYPCPADANGGVVVCGSDGVLRGEPRGRVSFTSFNEQRDYADLAVPAGFDVVADTFTTSFTNDDPCRAAIVIVEREADVDFILPAGAGAAYGQDTDEMYYTRNTGTTTINDAHAQSTKVFRHTLSLAPGGIANVVFPVTLGRGSGGATYNRIQVFIRALLISL